MQPKQLASIVYKHTQKSKKNSKILFKSALSFQEKIVYLYSVKQPLLGTFYRAFYTALCRYI